MQRNSRHSEVGRTQEGKLETQITHHPAEGCVMRKEDPNDALRPLVDALLVAMTCWCHFISSATSLK